MGKRYTYEEVKEEFDNRGYDLISTKYKNCSTKLDYICRRHKDKGVQQITFTKFYHSGQGCYYCGRERTEEAHRTPLNIPEDKELCLKNNFTYISSKKINGIYYISFICNKHKDLGMQSMRKNNIKRGIKGCKYCSGKQFPEWYVMEKKNEVNPNIEIRDKYINLTSPITCFCLIHNIEYKSTMQNVLNGHGCYYCGLNKLSEQNMLTEEIINQNIHKLNSHVDLVKYNGASNLSNWYCNKHNKNFQRCYRTLLQCISGCDLCYRENIRAQDGMGNEEFLKRLHEKHPETDAMDEYINYTTPIDFYCNVHDCYFSSAPVDILDRVSCCPKSFVTYKEEAMCSLIEDWGYKITRQKKFEGCKDKRYLPFDCYLDDYNTCIEYDGEQHFKPVKFGTQSYEDAVRKHEYIKKHDEMKNAFCKDNSINLIRIPYYEFEDLEYYLFDKFTSIGIISEIKSN